MVFSQTKSFWKHLIRNPVTLMHEVKINSPSCYQHFWWGQLGEGSIKQLNTKILKTENRICSACPRRSCGLFYMTIAYPGFTSKIHNRIKWIKHSVSPRWSVTCSMHSSCGRHDVYSFLLMDLSWGKLYRHKPLIHHWRSLSFESQHPCHSWKKLVWSKPVNPVPA